MTSLEADPAVTDKGVIVVSAPSIWICTVFDKPSNELGIEQGVAIRRQRYP
jgi:hypothetical protein